MKKERLKYVDLLKVMAMIPVLVHHWKDAIVVAGANVKRDIIPDTVFNTYLGPYGVAIFFILSGLSLMYTYDGKLDLKKYFVNRFKGIFPMFWLAYLIVFFIRFSLSAGTYNYGLERWKLIWTITGMDGYFNLFDTNWYILGEWFLGCLILLYILFPVLKIGIEKKPIITGVVILAIYLTAQLWYKYLNCPIPIDNFFLFRIPEFAFGMYFIKYWKTPNAVSGIISLLCLIVLNFIPYPFSVLLYSTTLSGVFTVVFVAWICQFIKSETFFNVFRIIARYCYPVFLIHHVIMYKYTLLYKGTELGYVRNFVAFFISLILIAIASVLLDVANRKILSLFKKDK